MENLKNTCFMPIISALVNSENAYRSLVAIEKNDLVEKLTIEISSVNHVSKFVLTFSLVVSDDEDDDLLDLEHFFDNVFYADCLVSSEGILDDVEMFVGYFFDEHDDNLAFLYSVSDTDDQK